MVLFNNGDPKDRLANIRRDRRIKISVFSAIAASRRIGGHVRQNWRHFLEICWPALGPAQRQHVTAHCQAVAMLSANMAARAGFTDEMIDTMHTAGLLHDIGKCFISDDLLAKPSRLSDAEWRVMNRHSAAGAWLCRQLGADDMTVELVMGHHISFGEQPTRIKAGGKAVSDQQDLGMRILTVADAFVTMCSERSYCTAMSLGQAIGELQRCQGKQFDPRAVELAQGLYSNAA